MKNLIILISLSFLISCQQQVKEVEVSKRIGYDVSDESGKNLIYMAVQNLPQKFGKIILKPIMKGIWRQ